jgi:hypothetical protein
MNIGLNDKYPNGRVRDFVLAWWNSKIWGGADPIMLVNVYRLRALGSYINPGPHAHLGAIMRVGASRAGR